jgi:hypothetical protein
MTLSSEHNANSSLECEQCFKQREKQSAAKCAHLHSERCPFRTKKNVQSQVGGRETRLNANKPEVTNGCLFFKSDNFGCFLLQGPNSRKDSSLARESSALLLFVFVKCCRRSLKESSHINTSGSGRFLFSAALFPTPFSFKSSKGKLSLPVRSKLRLFCCERNERRSERLISLHARFDST